MRHQYARARSLSAVSYAAQKAVAVSLTPVYRDRETGHVLSVAPAQPAANDQLPRQPQVRHATPAPSQQQRPAHIQVRTPFHHTGKIHPNRPPALLGDMEIATWQIALERRNFSCGPIDGDWGMRSRRAVSQFQKSMGLVISGDMDDATRVCLSEPSLPFCSYIVTAEDMAKVVPTPTTWKGKAQATYLGYNDAWEMLAEKFHTTPVFLQQLNPECAAPQAGVSLQAPNVEPATPLPPLGQIHILLSETTLLLFDRQGKCVGCFPCSIAADKNKRPAGDLHVIVIAPNPNYTFNPELFPDVAAQEGIKNKLVVPPGPNNPVGMAWIGLSLPGYGIHGTPEPSAISRTGSKGCFRLSNWNAVRLLGKVSKGTSVVVEP